MIASYPQGDILGAGMEKISILSTLSWSVWACLALSLAAFAVAVANVYKENKTNKYTNRKNFHLCLKTIQKDYLQPPSQTWANGSATTS